MRSGEAPGGEALAIASWAGSSSASRSSATCTTKPAIAAIATTARPTCPAPNTISRGWASSGSTNSETVPPQHIPSAWVRLCSTKRGRPSSRVWAAAAVAASASAPPPTVPSIRPSGWTIMRAPAARGAEPAVRTTVTRAARAPSASKAASRANRDASAITRP